ncbi:MAG: hypothetical protein RLZZ480_699 [Candidatus Parcubacteria bacterium]
MSSVSERFSTVLYGILIRMDSSKNVVYTALFVVDKDLLLSLFEPAHKTIYAHHSTIAFRPGSLAGIEVGKRHTIKVVGRVIDEKGDALLVENPRSQNKFPHITLSTIKGTPPMYSNEMIEKAGKAHIIEYFEEPTEIDVVEGYFDGENDVVTP